jgi:hypothetical protein
LITTYATKEFGEEKKDKKMKEKQHSVGGKELIPNTHSREVIKLHLSFCGMYDDLIGMSNTPTSP